LKLSCVRCRLTGNGPIGSGELARMVLYERMRRLNAELGTD